MSTDISELVSEPTQLSEEELDMIKCESSGVQVIERDDDDGSIEWEPYEGPQGGQGWQTTEPVDGEVRVSYDDRPPGDVPSMSELAEPTINIDATDVEENDYIKIEEIGYEDVDGLVEDVSRVGNEVVIDFYDGPSVRVHQEDVEAGSVEIFVDDEMDTATYREMVGRGDAYQEVSSIPVSDWPEGRGVSREELFATVAEGFNRCNVDGAASKMSAHLSEFRDEVERSGYYNGEVSGEPAVELKAEVADATDSIHHEMAHAFINQYGATNADDGKVFSMFYFPGVLDYVELGKDSFDVYDDIVDGKINEARGVNFLDASYMRGRMESVKDQLENKTIDEDFFHLKGVDDDAPPEVHTLVDEANEAWRRIFEDTDTSILHPYSGTNANETLAQTHELLQGTGMGYEEAENLLRNHSEFLEAYLEVFEPADRQKSVLNEAWGLLDEDEVEAFDEPPFSEQEEIL